MMRHWLGSLVVALCCLGLVAPALHAQAGSGVVFGKVADAATGLSVAGATVVLVPSGKRARSKLDGSFTIVGLPPGGYTLVCRKPGYQTTRTPGLRLAAGARLEQACLLQPAPRAEEKRDAHRAAALAPRSERQEPEADRYGVGYGTLSGKRARVVGGVVAGTYGGTLAPAHSNAAPAAPAPPPADVELGANREGYETRDENPFVAPTDQPLSTFSIDVDTAGYANLRRFIEGERQLPPRDAVKIEEMVNYFPYTYADPRGELPFAVTTELAAAPWNEGHHLVRIGVQGRRMSTANLPASNLVFLLDVSGSMSSPDKLPLLKSALSLLVNELRPNDRVAIVVYAGAAGLVLPSTPGTQKDRILAALDQLQSGGSTAGSAGIALAYEVARENFIRGGNNRVILATDGDFNVGPSSDAELVRLIEDKRKQGVFLTVLGFGTGNYQDAKMEKLADTGNGNHAYIDSLAEARKVLVSEMGGTLFTIAKDVKLQIEFNPAEVKAYRLIGYENRMLAARDFNDDKKDAGELGAGHSVTAFYELIPAGSPEPVAGVDELKYQKVAATGAAASTELLTLKLRYKAPDGDTSKLITTAVEDAPAALARTSDDFRFATAVVELGLILRGSEHRGTASYDRLLRRAEGALGADRGGYRAAFLQLARTAQALGTPPVQVAR
jgi:Ca-activated chloride channel family protein